MASSGGSSPSLGIPAGAAEGSGATGTLEGTLSKWTNVMKGWQYRFFALDENAGLLSYYTVHLDTHTCWLCTFIA
ncbi:oxysterol-binding protein-related protein 10-like [Drosophila ficusphila]|uniref:oxysterol-binding protein-related protein 10-like n=1 Tax=Drosophila ficusphila TaxID=30025 RepID=UPI0007E87EF4|nr:oxysterol-binding protein-related protein 10-like [Drosophila ficusphila]